MTSSLPVLSALLILAVGGCADDDGSTAGAGGSTPLPTTFGGDRPVELIVPSGYDPAEPAPLVILLHGYSAGGALQELLFGLRPLAEQHGALYAYPDGTVDEGGKRFWNATDGCCDFYDTGVDDSGYLRGLVEEIQSAYNVDPRRIAFTGHSNGGFMAYRMACDHSDLVAAIGGLAGAMFDNPADCGALEPVHVLHIHGSADDSVPYEGSTGDRNYPGAVESVEYWAAHNGCNPTATAGAALDLESGLPGNETTVARYEDCEPGGSAELWTIEGGAHLPAIGAEFRTRLVEFLLDHPKP
jgi:polyhydroxybutyrate depolymerase